MAGIPALAASTAPDVRLLFLVNILAVLTVTVFATTVVGLLLRRRYLRSLEEQKMTMIGAAYARILHQIKNPVQSLLLQAELMEEFDRDGADEARREAASAILGESLRLATMLNELSAWASGAQRELSLQPTALHDLLAGMTGQEQPEAARRGIQMDAWIGVEVTVRADAYYLRQALENLIRNAREALVGQPDARLHVELARAGSHAVVRVIDNGPGIPADRLTTIFEPFVSTKGSGMGLGLSISREIVERHGGELRVESAPGAGTTFSVFLPLHGDGRSTTTRHSGGSH